MKKFLVSCFICILIFANFTNVFGKVTFKDVAILKGRSQDYYIGFIQLSVTKKVILKSSLLGEHCTASSDELNIKFLGFNEKYTTRYL